jgi:phosphoglucomutase
MSEIRDSRSGLLIGDTDRPLVSPPTVVDPEQVAAAVDAMILSASGWRGVFASDGDEESRVTSVRGEHLVVTAIAARTFIERLFSTGAGRPRIAVGVDTRPTGPLIARAAIRAMLDLNSEPLYLFVAASPEISAWVREVARSENNQRPLGFYYVSASHNPIGHNGLKLGSATGEVIGGAISRTLIARFRELCSDQSVVSWALELLQSETSTEELACLRAAATNKEHSLAAYARFTSEVIGGPGPRANRAVRSLTRALHRIRPGILADLNGSARTLSIDQEFIRSHGCYYSSINAEAGTIAHTIVPEGNGLDQCRSEFARLAAEPENRFLLGYVPDNDGDRGNLIYCEETGEASAVDAQEVFALACVSELSWLLATGAYACDPNGRADRKVAVVVNGPTSMRIDRVCSLFGAELYRTEVGEANVVARAAELRAAGYLVRLAGEGSNGGNITHPGVIRDPIQTIFAVLKLLYTPSLDGPPPIEEWWKRSGYPRRGNPPGDLPLSGDSEPPTLASVIRSLPRFTTTSAFEERAVMPVPTRNHAALKASFESRLPRAISRRTDWFEANVGTSYRLVNYEGTREFAGPGGRSGEERGGLKVVFSDGDHDTAFAWMRGSGTEPVLRVMADVAGDRPEVEAELLRWLKELVAESAANAQD